MLNSDLDLQKPRICLKAKFLVITLHLCCDYTHTHTHTHTHKQHSLPMVRELLGEDGEEEEEEAKERQ